MPYMINPSGVKVCVVAEDVQIFINNGFRLIEKPQPKRKKKKAKGYNKPPFELDE